MYKAGDTIVLNGAPGWNENNSRVTLTGLFDLEEWVIADHAAYQWESGWYLSPHETDDEYMIVFVSWDVFCEQVYPKEHSKMLVQEREMEFAEE